RDTELDRDVAVKILPESFVSDANRLERFQREAKALAALSHPNLLDIYDVGTTDGLHYAVTELLEGDTLRERITPSGLPWKKVTSIGAAVADGLAAAHGRGIIHRDIKPENLFLTADGRVKILDFGLASVHEEADADAETATITEAGTVMGTPGYMAPEQVKGKQADARSDIFSLGCVIYEMASGHRAFRGETGVEVIANILKEEPPQLSSSGASVPVDLERAVHRCLEKRPEARFQSAADLAYSLKSVGLSGTSPVMATPGSGLEATTEKKFSLPRIGAIAALLILAVVTSWWALTQRGGEQAPIEAASTLDPNRIAVVPFTNRTGDPTLDALGHRTADRIAQQLTEMEELEVVPPSSVAAALATEGSTPSDTRSLVGEVTTATSAGLVLSGVIDASGDRIEMQATLEDAVEGRVVRAFKPVISDRTDPSTAITTFAERSFMATSDHLHPSLTFGAGDDLPNLETYLDFRRQLRVADRDNFRPFMGLIHAYPDFTRLRLMLTASFLNGKRFQMAKEFLEAGMTDEADLNQHQETTVLALRNWISGSYDQAYRLFRDELERSPRNLVLMHVTIRCALYANRPAAAVAIYRGLVLDDAVPPSIYIFMATDTAAAHHLLGQNDEAIRLLRQILDDNPSSGLTDWSRTQYINILGATGDIEEMERLLEEGAGHEFLPIESVYSRLSAAHELRAHGYHEASRTMAERALSGFLTEWLDPSNSAYVQVMKWRLEALLIAGHDREAAELASGLDFETAGWRAALLYAGVASARVGDATTARQKSDRIDQLTDDDLAGVGLAPGDLVVARAMIAAQMGEVDESLELLRSAFAFGAKQVDEDNPLPELRHNIFFEPLWDHPEFQEILRPKG
ncbi:MAG: protein kinase, partial [Thermoanaerobaculales bacterium]|nr:protein kinase [Thermoanaerobaculales bacterium]